MKKTYDTPMAEKVEFNYQETVTASGASGHKYRLYTDGYYGCREVETDTWID